MNHALSNYWQRTIPLALVLLGSFVLSGCQDSTTFGVHNLCAESVEIRHDSKPLGPSRMKFTVSAGEQREIGSLDDEGRHLHFLGVTPASGRVEHVYIIDGQSLGAPSPAAGYDLEIILAGEDCVPQVSGVPVVD